MGCAVSVKKIAASTIVYLSLSGCWGPSYPDNEGALEQIRSIIAEVSPNADYSVSEVHDIRCFEAGSSEGVATHSCVMGIVVIAPGGEKLDSSAQLGVDASTGEFIKDGAPFTFEARIELQRLIDNGFTLDALSVKSFDLERLEASSVRVIGGKYFISPFLELVPLRPGQSHLDVPMEMIREDGKWSLDVLAIGFVPGGWVRNIDIAESANRISVEINGEQGRIYAYTNDGDHHLYYFRSPPPEFRSNGGFVNIGKVVGSTGDNFLIPDSLQFGPADQCQFKLIAEALLQIACSRNRELNGFY